ncbi:MAG: FKBP-type peptidyl-prolyl cis-trans isomerase [Candidatus Thermoplasmatota archaeon]
MTKVAVIDPQSFEGKHAVSIHSVIAEKKAEANRGVTFAVVLKNDGNVRDRVGLKATVPSGWSCVVNERPVVPAGTARVVFLTLTPSAGTTGSTEVPLSAISAWNGTSEASTSVRVTIAALGAQVKGGDKVTANYAGFLLDGRLFDTSMEAVGKDAAMPKLNTSVGGWQGRPSYSSFPFTVGSGVIEGFTSLAKTAKVGETVTMHIPAKDAYATGNMYQRPLTGRDLVFELEIVSVG